MTAPGVNLREVRESDLPILFEQQRDPEACRIAAFTSSDPSDREAFEAHQAKILADESITIRTVLFEGTVAGSISCFEMFGDRCVAYWIDRALWGRGVATAALTAFLDVVRERPLTARVASDNAGSRRVLEKCGFVPESVERGFANARGCEIEEHVYRLGD